MSEKVVDETKAKIKEYGILDEGGLGDSWFQGYISALAGYDLITEAEFDELLELSGMDMDKYKQAVDGTGEFTTH